MKRLLRAFLVMALVLATTGVATSAYFTSSVTAADNEIRTGTLMLALDSTRVHTYTTPPAWGGDNAYTVVEDVDGVSTAGQPFEPWLNAEPGTYVAYSNDSGADNLPAGNFSVWLAIRNKGTISFNVGAEASGGWVLPLPRQSTDPACASVTADPTLVKVMNIYRYANGGAVPSCLSHEECRNLRDALLTGPWTTVSGYSARSWTGPIAGFWSDDEVAFDANEFGIYRIDLNLDSTTDNCYQGATYQYDLNGVAKQVGAPSFP